MRTKMCFMVFEILNLALKKFSKFFKSILCEPCLRDTLQVVSQFHTHVG